MATYLLLSTNTLSLELVQAFNTAEYTGTRPIGEFVDLKKPLTLDHDIMRSTLHQYGITRIVLDWVCSYLRNRKQYVDSANRPYRSLGARQWIVGNFGFSQRNTWGLLTNVCFVCFFYT